MLPKKLSSNLTSTTTRFHMEPSLKNKYSRFNKHLKSQTLNHGSLFKKLKTQTPNSARQVLQSKSSGFTMIELMVSIGVFAIIASLVIGGFVSSSRNARGAAALAQASSNGSLILSQIRDEVREESVGISLPPCPDHTSSITFRDDNNNSITYELSGTEILRTLNFDDATPVTDENLIVHYLRFCGFSGAPETRVTISLGISPSDGTFRDKILNFQTSVLPREAF